ncbi:MAG: ABC transporter permease, partial [Bacteroidota bacterium]
GGQYATVSLYKSTASLIVGNLLYKDGVTTLRTISGGVLLKKLRSKGLSTDRAMAVINPIRIDSQSLFNPNYSYLSYLLPGLVTALVQMIIMITSVLIISSEFTHHSFGELYSTSGNSIFNIVVGKSIPHLLLHYSTAVGIIGLLFPLFGIELHGILLNTLLFMFLFITAVFFMGFLISCMFHEQLLATELALFINTPAFIFSGFTFPLWSMPAMHNYFAQAIPFTHFLNGFIKIYQMNAPFRYAMPEIKVLGTFLVVSLVLSFIVLHFQSTSYLAKGNNSVKDNN